MFPSLCELCFGLFSSSKWLNFGLTLSLCFPLSVGEDKNLNIVGWG